MPPTRLARFALKTVLWTSFAVALSASGEPPEEFRLFTKGWNDTSKGRFLFDDAAAKAVMADYRTHGADIMIDLEHQSLDGAIADPTARDARGWANLELRNGDLWAVGAKWTTDGAARLTDKRQRYVSPAFNVDPDTKRITSILNVAITSLPATHQTPALVAASQTSGDKMTVEEFLKVLEALGIDPTSMSIDDALAKVKGGTGGDTTTDPVTDPTETTADNGDAPPAPEKKQDVAAAASRLMVLTGASSFVEAIEKVDAFRTSHIELETERQKLAKERGVLEAAERRELTAKRVTLAGRKPSEVWADDSATAPKGYYATMPIADYRALVTDEIKASSRTTQTQTQKPAPGVQPPAGAGSMTVAGEQTFQTEHGAVTLSAREIRRCGELGAKVEEYASNKAYQAAVAARKVG